MVRFAKAMEVQFDSHFSDHSDGFTESASAVGKLRPLSHKSPSGCLPLRLRGHRIYNPFGNMGKELIGVCLVIERFLQ